MAAANEGEITGQNDNKYYNEMVKPKEATVSQNTPDASAQGSTTLEAAKQFIKNDTAAALDAAITREAQLGSPDKSASKTQEQPQIIGQDDTKYYREMVEHQQPKQDQDGGAKKPGQGSLGELQQFVHDNFDLAKKAAVISEAPGGGGDKPLNMETATQIGKDLLAKLHIETPKDVNMEQVSSKVNTAIQQGINTLKEVGGIQ